jgi:hypothetical protein
MRFIIVDPEKRESFTKMIEWAIGRGIGKLVKNADSNIYKGRIDSTNVCYAVEASWPANKNPAEGEIKYRIVNPPRTPFNLEAQLSLMRKENRELRRVNAYLTGEVKRLRRD